MTVFILGIAIGFGIAILLGASVNKWGHTCKWEARSLTHMTISTTIEDIKYTKADVTEVLYICSCGEVKTKQLTGTWRMEDIQVTSPKSKDNELERLRKMAGMEDSQ